MSEVSEMVNEARRLESRAKWECVKLRDSLEGGSENKPVVRRAIRYLEEAERYLRQASDALGGLE